MIVEFWQLRSSPHHYQGMPLIVYLSVDCSEISTAEKAFVWPRPWKCPRCGGLRLWGHGYVARFFDGYRDALWMKRWRCPDCGAVHTARPTEYWRGFWATAKTIIECLRCKTDGLSWSAEVTRQRQRYWWAGLELQRHISAPVVKLDQLLRSNLIVATHSLLYREIRSCREPPHRIFAFTPCLRGP
jgi:rubredoxin